MAFSPIDLATPIVEKIIEKTAEVVKDTGLKGFRITQLPRHEEDFAEKWFYGNISEISPENITAEFNAYLQVLKELKEDKIKLPNNFDGPTLAFDLDTEILKDFREKNISYSPEDNLIHRAWFAHCAKRALDGLRNGRFSDEQGYEKKQPELADIIERRINQIIVEKTLYNT